jgi:hypothetical protein
MDLLNSIGYAPKELFSQKGSTSEDAKFNKTLMADLSRQAKHPMMVVSANAAYCYNHVNHIIMSLVWLVLTNGNIPAIVVSLICLQTMNFFQRTGFGKSKIFFGGTSWSRANIELIVFCALRVLSRAYTFPPYVLGTLFPAPHPASLQCALQRSSIA